MKFAIPLICLVLMISNLCVSAAESIQVPGHKTKAIENWTVLINDKLLEKETAATKKALELLEAQLQEIVQKVPASVVAELQTVPLWFSPEYQGVTPRAEYHPGADWLRDNHRDPQMVKSIEFTNIRIFERETKRMPNFALHELAHAYHHRVLPQGFDNPEVIATFEKAKSAGLYARVEQRLGDGQTKQARSYALTNHKEYFAECSESFFSTNDFFPYNREQLAKYDPAMFALLKKLWKEPEPQK